MGNQCEMVIASNNHLPTSDAHPRSLGIIRPEILLRYLGDRYRMVRSIITQVDGHQNVPGAQSPEMHFGFLQHAAARLALVSIMGAGRERATRPADAPRSVAPKRE